MKSASDKRAALIKEGKLKVLDRDMTIAVLHLMLKEDLGDIRKMVDDGVLQAGLENEEFVMWLALEPDEIKVTK